MAKTGKKQEELSKNEKFKYALCYLPVVWIVLFFTENLKTDSLKKHIKYWTALFLTYILARFIIVWVLMLPFWTLLWLAYIWIIWFLVYKVYSWEDVKIEYIDEIEKKIKDKSK